MWRWTRALFSSVVVFPLSLGTLFRRRMPLSPTTLLRLSPTTSTTAPLAVLGPTLDPSLWLLWPSPTLSPGLPLMWTVLPQRLKSLPSTTARAPAVFRRRPLTSTTARAPAVFRRRPRSCLPLFGRLGTFAIVRVCPLWAIFGTLSTPHIPMGRRSTCRGHPAVFLRQPSPSPAIPPIGAPTPPLELGTMRP